MTRIAETCWCGASFEIDIPGVRDLALMHYREWKRHTHRRPAYRPPAVEASA